VGKIEAVTPRSITDLSQIGQPLDHARETGFSETSTRRRQPHPSVRLCEITLLWHVGELEIHACIVIYFLRRSEIKLIKRYIAVMLIPDIKCGPRQEVIMNLHRRATVFEDKGDRVLALQS
jgi:hypothetical protein